MSGNSSSFAISPPAIIKNPTTIRYTIAAANTEEPVALPTGTKAYLMTNVGSRLVKYAFTSGDIAGGDFNSLYPFQTRQPPGIIAQANVTIYVESPGLETIELEIWR